VERAEKKAYVVEHGETAPQDFNALKFSNDVLCVMETMPKCENCDEVLLFLSSFPTAVIRT
jgi:hypothetical protein